MKRVIHSLLYILTISIFISCEDEQTNSKIDTLTDILTITEASHASDVPALLITHIEQFIYINKRLELYINTQSYNKDKIINNSNISYEKNAVVICDGQENKYIYTLNSHSHASTCEFKEPGTDSERLHVFINNAEGHLGIMEEYVNKKLCYSITFVYNDGNLISTTTKSYTTDNAPPETGTQLYTTGKIPNKDGLPFLPFTETYPLYFHKAAYYAGIINIPIKNLPESSYFEGNTREKTSYIYETNAEGHITSCAIETTSYGVSYSRVFNYSYE